MIAWSSQPLGILIAGPLADNVFEPLFMQNGALASTIGKLIGTGAGRGTGFFFILIGLAIVLTTLFAYTYRPLRDVERDIPDAIPDVKPLEA